MKPAACFLTISLALACTARGQGPEAKSELYRKLEEQKLSRPVFRAAKWTTDLDEALARGKREQKLVFVYLTRSFVT